MRDAHGQGRGPFRCPYCNKIFKNKSSLRYHLYCNHNIKDKGARKFQTSGDSHSSTFWSLWRCCTCSIHPSMKHNIWSSSIHSIVKITSCLFFCVCLMKWHCALLRCYSVSGRRITCEFGALDNQITLIKIYPSATWSNSEHSLQGMKPAPKTLSSATAY